MKLTTRQVVTSGILTALTIAMGATGIGFIPVPTPAGAATLMHLPVILAGILEGPVIGALTGLIFGLFTLQFLPDPFVVLPARLLIGVVAFLVYRATRRTAWGTALAAAAGSATNTVGTLGLFTLLGYAPISGKGGVIAIAVTHGIPEAIVAAIVIMPVVMAVTKVRAGSNVAAELRNECEGYSSRRS
ncbi:MAG TPA: ECF transporter S component [Firmicutes bacterium]|nr:ECF transporter S component [Bacillota bacterium]